jgi:hypothetical protein
MPEIEIEITHGTSGKGSDRAKKQMNNPASQIELFQVASIGEGGS